MYFISSVTAWASTKFWEPNFTAGNWKENRYRTPVVSPVSAGYRSHYLFCHQRSDRLCCCWNGTCHRKQDQNGAIGVLKDLETPVNSVAVWAKESGKRVGIATSVSVDHATPAAFYAHEAGRGSYYEIGKDLYTTGFDFYAGSDFLDPDNGGKAGSENLYSMAERNGYTIARGYKEYLKRVRKRIR